MASITSTPPIYQRRILTSVLTFQDLYRILARSAAVYIDGYLTDSIKLCDGNYIRISSIVQGLTYNLDLWDEDFISIEIKDGAILVTDHTHKQITLLEPLVRMKL